MPAAALGPEVAHPRTDRVVGQTEALGDGLGRQPLNKEGVQRGEATVEGLGGFEEEAAARGIVHEGLRTEGEFGGAGTVIG